MERERKREWEREREWELPYLYLLEITLFIDDFNVWIIPNSSLIIAALFDHSLSTYFFSLVSNSFSLTPLFSNFICYSSWNSEISQIYPQFSLQSINRLERLFCSEIKWDLYISSSAYAKYYFALRSLTEKKDFRRWVKWDERRNGVVFDDHHPVMDAIWVSHLLIATLYDVQNTVEQNMCWVRLYAHIHRSILHLRLKDMTIDCYHCHSSQHTFYPYHLIFLLCHILTSHSALHSIWFILCVRARITSVLTTHHILFKHAS